MRVPVIAAATLVLLGSTSYAQRTFTLAHTGIEVGPPTTVGESESALEITTVRWTLAGVVPVRVGDKTRLLVRPRYRYWRYDADDADDVAVHDFGVSLGVVRPLGSGWAVVVTGGIGLATDYEDVDREHVRLTAGVIGQRRFNRQIRAGLGVASSYVFGELLPVPLVVVDWLPRERLHLLATLPQRAALTYRLTPWSTIGVVAELDGNRFELTGSEDVDNLGLSRGSAQVRGAVRVTGNLWAVAHVGGTFFSRLQVYDEDNVELADLSLERGFLAGVAVELIIPEPLRRRAGAQ